MRGVLWLSALALLFTVHASAAEDFSFDIASYQKKNYQFGGFLQLNIDHQVVAEDSYATRLFFLNTPRRDAITEHAAALELSGEYEQQDWYARATYHGEAYDSELNSDREGSFYEALLAYQPDPVLTLEMGKKAIKWGKGYAWSPVGFVERPKDPDDPELAREGYVVATADLIKSFNGDLKTLAFTPVYLPVTDSLNNEYGVPDHDNLALKVYVLYNDIDIDVMVLSEGSRSRRYGFDFSRNISTNFEVHGEWAAIVEINRTLVSSNGAVSGVQESATQWLLGLRYLTENETTIIAEYYRNSGGYSSGELEAYFSAVDAAFAGSDTPLLNTLATIGTKNYLVRNPGREYCYVRVSNKEPFDWLYFTPAVTLMANLQDGSYSLAPELLYIGVEDFELRFKATLLRGDQYSEFGEKRNRQRFELRARYFF
jgi:hypothetical protein